MNIIPANELKIKGVSLLEKALEEDSEIGISIRGQERFVVMDKAHYDYLRECELLSALAETKEDLISGKFLVESVAKHMKRMGQ